MHMTRHWLLATVASVVILLPHQAFASSGATQVLDGISDPRAIFCLLVFILSYTLVIAEEKTHLRKSKPVMLGAGIIWVVIAYAAPDYGIDHDQLHQAISHGLEEYGSLLLFLMAAMIYISALERMNVFGVLRAKLVSMGLNYRQVFWVTGIIAFFLSAIADNLTTAPITRCAGSPSRLLR